MSGHVLTPRTTQRERLIGLKLSCSGVKNKFISRFLNCKLSFLDRAFVLNSFFKGLMQ